MSTVDTDGILDAWRERGFHGGVGGDPPGQVWCDYIHEEDELLMLVEGHRFRRVGVPIGAGCVFAGVLGRPTPSLSKRSRMNIGEAQGREGQSITSANVET
jgi:hypothetical protein